MDDIDVGREMKDVTLADEIAAAERSISRGEGLDHDDALRLVMERVRRASPPARSDPC